MAIEVYLVKLVRNDEAVYIDSIWSDADYAHARADAITAEKFYGAEAFVEAYELDACEDYG